MGYTYNPFTGNLEKIADTSAESDLNRSDLGISEFSNMDILNYNSIHHMDTKEQILWEDELLIIWNDI